MKLLPRAPARLALTALVAGALALSGCGSSDAPTAKTPSKPSTSTTATPSATSSATASPFDGRTQVVKVAKYGVSFEIPKGWLTLDAKKVLKGGTGKNPVLDELADRLGTTREQLVQSFSSLVQTMSISDAGAHHGILDNINSVGQAGDLNDDQLKLQLATVGAKLTPLRHTTSDAGDVTLLDYTLNSKAGITIRGAALAVRMKDATVLISVTSSSAQRADELANLILGSLKKIPGAGPNL